MNVKNLMSKRMIALVMCGVLLVPTCSMANELEDNISTETVSLTDYENYIKSRDGIAARSGANDLSVEAFNYMIASVNESDLNEILNEYNDVAFTREKTYQMFEANLNGIFQEVEANDFTGEQAAQLLKSAADLETGNAEVTDFTPVEPGELPNPHDGDQSTSEANLNVSLLSNNDISGRDGDKTGLGYEVLSLPGYNKTTTYFYPAECNINREGLGGIAGYMMYTIAGGGGVNDIGIVYSSGYWHPCVNGTWTNHATGPAHLTVGDKLYYKIWIGTDQYIYFQGIDGDNFNNIIFQSKYDTWQMLPSSGYGVTFNRQITYAANQGYQTDHTGYYLKNARYEQAYLYNNTGYAPFNSSNTQSTNRGKFGASWAPSSNVTINSNTHWDSENITIDMK